MGNRHGRLHLPWQRCKNLPTAGKVFCYYLLCIGLRPSPRRVKARTGPLGRPADGLTGNGATWVAMTPLAMEKSFFVARDFYFNERLAENRPRWNPALWPVS